MNLSELLRADREQVDVVHPLVRIDPRDVCLCTFQNIKEQDAGPIV